ncbi:GIY-YIG nuclease family protein [Neorhizobium sp. NCHU2750]|uniref:GIY-YIG nuclease family protein n=1 Tax=Neorhizobium sp. NCHU2750 TaxID=1825976 RepID=UPI000E733377|nr:hypothetical protein NCHU2750_15110 [Neorhizobium sp. NCHU2750]
MTTNFETSIARLETKIDDLSKTVNRLMKREYRKRDHLPKDSGVYEIINTITGEKYVGSAKNICTRISAHFSKLRKGESESVLLQKSFDEYGEYAFSTRVIELVSDREERLDLEQFYIDKADEYTLNTLRSSRGRHGMENTTETKRKMAASKTGEMHPKFKGYYTTPFGTFTSPYAASLACPDKLISHSAVAIYCEKSDTIINRNMLAMSRYLKANFGEEILGMSFKEIGFGFVAADFAN